MATAPLLTAGRYVESAEKLQTEANISLSQTDVADNVDLINVIQALVVVRRVLTDGQEFESYFEMKFGKKPKLTRKVTDLTALPRLPPSVAKVAAGTQKPPAAAGSTGARKLSGR